MKEVFWVAADGCGSDLEVDIFVYSSESKLINFNVFNRKCQKTVKHKVTFNLFVFKEVHIYFF
jgi:hypothetical protein